ncbi:glycosyl hydrolase [Sporosarcina sp. FSL K6-1508]|uniref:glycosyl hydrolase n=1 Tax=Sporosarcina sp. FSL K6-1508 TaxID=2921553 RepID=UPI0030F510C0
MRYRYFLIAGLILCSGFFSILYEKKVKKSDAFTTEAFIEKWLTNDNGTLATYMKAGDEEDSDLVKGREALSESLGIWMHYALLKEDEVQFEHAYQQLTNYFLENDGFVRWKLTEAGENKVFANALVDDLRICGALFDASEKWNEPRYEKAAVRISSYLTAFNQSESSLTDYYVKDEGTSQYITLSYIEPDSLAKLNQRGLIDKAIYEKMLAILKNAPLDGFYYPKAYDVEKDVYLFDSEINMVDQSLVALYRGKKRYSTTAFLDFIKEEIELHGAIYGRYDRFSGGKLVDYESPAVYGWLILYSLELHELELAQKLYSRMSQFKLRGSKYTGGYAVYNDDTHIFDNLVPLLAERELDNLNLLR